MSPDVLPRPTRRRSERTKGREPPETRPRRTLRRAGRQHQKIAAVDLPFYLPGRILRVWGTLVGRPPLRFGQRRDGTGEPRQRYGRMESSQKGTQFPRDHPCFLAKWSTHRLRLLCMAIEQMRKSNQMPDENSTTQRRLAATIVAAYVRHNQVQPDQLAVLISTVHQAPRDSVNLRQNPSSSEPRQCRCGDPFTTIMSSAWIAVGAGKCSAGM